jgi:hypothetical protein
MDVKAESETLRAAQNQSLYRAVNEQIQGVNGGLADLLSMGGSWVCECADRDCTEPMELTLAEYEAVRAHPNRFAVLPGHAYEEVERVVEEHDRYVVVEKLGEGAQFAVENDPRRA